MSSRAFLAGAFLLACLWLTGCTGRQILAMRTHPPAQPTAGAPGAQPATFTGPALAAKTDYPKDANAPRPEPPVEYASMKNPLPPTAANVSQGQQLYNANCAPCHGSAGRGDGPAASALNPKPANFTAPIHGELPDGYWFWRVSKGGSVPPFTAAGSAMPPWEGSLSPNQRWLVILYVKSFSGHK